MKNWVLYNAGNRRAQHSDMYISSHHAFGACRLVAQTQPDSDCVGYIGVGCVVHPPDDREKYCGGETRLCCDVYIHFVDILI